MPLDDRPAARFDMAAQGGSPGQLTTAGGIVEPGPSQPAVVAGLPGPSWMLRLRRGPDDARSSAAYQS